MKVAAFNAKNLGVKKVTDKTISRYLTKIISQYSVIVILEVVDKSGEAMKTLKQELNKTSCNRQRPYSMVASVQLGRDTYKEQFVCFYRQDEVTLTDFHQYEDNQVGDEDAFAREPFILRFSCPATDVEDLVLIPVHTKPEDSLKELDELYDVVDAVRKKWGTDNIMILGDFNADGRYLSKKKKEQIRILSAPYHWLIDDDVDTTTSNSNDNTYDRIVVYGDAMLEAVVPRSAKSFNFQRKFKLTDKETLSISDHYPVEVELKSSQKHKAPRQRTMAVSHSTKTTSIKGQTQRKGPQKKKVQSATPQKKKVQSATPQKKKVQSATPQKKKKKKVQSATPQKKKVQSATPQKKRVQSV
ncbi:deoxyribonuclease-1-like [Seriola lalandi dorsalis]|uniref:deoxyribonuclease-1-like n=1 Tax=Seriola lalandi dorsalis TaxID=1841481 RepID=UPI000C6F7056|nr:deoxyribonuclease-1-like [Seriola lalandi dorsalis]